MTILDSDRPRSRRALRADRLSERPVRGSAEGLQHSGSEPQRADRPSGIAPGEALRSGGRASYGEEREIAVLFCGIRGFTSFAEHRLPCDVVFILNRYFDRVGRAVTESGGLVDKFVGDGAMALFGVSSSPSSDTGPPPA